MGKIRGTLHVRKDIFVLHSHHQVLGKSSVFKKNLIRKDFQETTRLAWAQEVPISNLGAPTKSFNELQVVALIAVTAR
jgi:hypothetical protein